MLVFNFAASYPGKWYLRNEAGTTNDIDIDSVQKDDPDLPNEWAWVLNAKGWMVFGPVNLQAEST